MNKKKIIASAALTTCLCASLIAGATYALFTSEDKVNIAVTSGTVKVTATVDNLKTYSAEWDDGQNEYAYPATAENGTFTNRGTAKLEDGTLTLNNITPGDKATFDIEIVNESNVNVLYRVNYTVEGELRALATSATGIEFNAWSAWNVGEESSKTVSVTVELPIEVGNDYQGEKSAVAFTVEAVQGNANVEENKDDGFVDLGNRTYSVTNANGLRTLSSKLNSGEIAKAEGRGITVELMNDIDLSGSVWSPIESGQWVTFNGNYHTISNMNSGHDQFDRSGLFGYGGNAQISNLTLSNVTVRGSQAGAFAGNTDQAFTMTNCRLEGSVNVSYENFTDTTYDEGYSGLGVFVGVTQYALSITDTTLSGNVTVDLTGLNNSVILDNRTENLLGGFYTSENYTINVNYNADDISVKENSCIGLYNVADLKRLSELVNKGNAYTGKTFKLMNDIDFTGVTDWEPIGKSDVAAGAARDLTGAIAAPIYFAGSFDGNGHTISNLNLSEDNQRNLGFFGVVILPEGAKIENIKFDNVVVKGNSECAGVLAGAVSSMSQWISGSGFPVAIENVTVTNATVSGAKYVGGFVGYNQSSIKDITVSGSKVSAVYNENYESISEPGENDSGENAGGAVGDLYASYTADRVTVTDTEVSGLSKLGGVAGSSRYAHAITNSTVSGLTIRVDATSEKDTVGWISGRVASQSDVGRYTGNSSSECKAYRGEEEITSTVVDCHIA